MDASVTKKRTLDEFMASESRPTTGSLDRSLPPIRHHDALIPRGGSVQDTNRTLPPLLTNAGFPRSREYYQQASPLSPSSTPCIESGAQYPLRSCPVELESGSKRQKLERDHFDHTSGMMSRSSPNYSASSHGNARYNEMLATSSTTSEPKLNCCGPSCSGLSCSKTRTVLRELADQLLLLEARLTEVLLPAEKYPRSAPGLEDTAFDQILAWARDIVRWNGLNLQDFGGRPTRGPEQEMFREAPTNDRQRGHEPNERKEYSPSQRDLSRPEHPKFPLPLGLISEEKRGKYSYEPPTLVQSPYPSGPASTPSYVSVSSPSFTSRSSRMLPSPTSMSFPNPHGPPSNSSTDGPPPPSAHVTHVQELQHEVSVKTLQYQTLRQEYDSLLQRLERERKRCAAFEKKGVVSETEVNRLTEETMNFQAQVESLEKQIERLEGQREDERKQHATHGTQYMQMMEMASRLQTKASAEKAQWLAEREELEKKIELLESGKAANTKNLPEQLNAALSASDIAQTKEGLSPNNITCLSTENVRLQSRIHSLESALRGMQEDYATINSAAQSIFNSGNHSRAAIESLLNS